MKQVLGGSGSGGSGYTCWCNSGISFKIIDISAIKLLSIIILGSIYLAFILIINLLMPIITKSRNSENTTYEINSIKADEYIFEMQLKNNLDMK